MFAGGTGTELDPYLVATAAQLNEVRDFPTAYFKQTADIDLVSFANWVPIGFVLFNEEFEVISNIIFSGGYDGGGYEISNLVCNRPDDSYSSLFGSVVIYDAGIAKFKNINIKNAVIAGCGDCGILFGNGSAEIDNCHVQGVITTFDSHCGGMAGKLLDRSTVLNSSADCAIIVTCDYVYNIGGFVGDCYAKTIANSYAIGSITAIGETVAEILNVGGFVGSACFEFGSVNTETVYSDSYSNVDITVDMADGNGVGGFAGLAETCSYINLYACGELNINYKGEYVYSADEIGGLFGLLYNIEETIITNCYYDSTIAEVSDTKGTPKTTTEMKEAETFLAWPSDDWALSETTNEGYPYLVDNNPDAEPELPPEEPVEEEELAHMIEQIRVTTSGNVKEFVGLSTDAKPTEDIGSGSTFIELDSGKTWIFSNGNINALTDNGWWERTNYVSMLA